MRALDVLRRPSVRSERLSLAEAYFNGGNGDPLGLGGFTTFSVGGQTYTVPVQTTMQGAKAESISNSFEGYVLGGLQGNGVIFTLVATRLRVFSEARFQFQKLNNGRPGDLFGAAALQILETPWPGGTTGDLLAVMLLHADMAGNAYVAAIRGQLVAMRPDWVEIVLTPRAAPHGDGTVGMEKVGYHYYEGGKNRGLQPTFFLPEEVAHFAPQPDPLAWYRGMSWLTPVVREIQGDGAMSAHKLKFFENAAAQPLDARILTPSGWTQMGEVQPGSRVIGPDGAPRSVIGVFPQGVKDVYRLSFSGGASTECCADHVWTVSNLLDRRLGRTRNMTLAQILADGVRYDCGTAKWAVQMPDPVEFDDHGPLGVDPYLLGCLLGDGSFRSNGHGSGGVSLSACITDADEQADLLAGLLPTGVSISRRDRKGWAEFYFKGPGGSRPNPLTGEVKRLGLFDVAGRDKFIPEQYMRASVKDRVSLLQGLIDTDGSTSARSGATFCNTSETLARQLKSLVQELGGIATISSVARQTCAPQWVVSISALPDWIVPCRLFRKQACWSPRRRLTRHRTLKSVELVRRAEVQCIKVDADDGLYVTDDCIVTHNTPNLAVKLNITDPETFDKFVDKMEGRHAGLSNAYRTLYTGAGADVTVIGQSMQQMDFKVTQAAGEVRLAQAAGVPPSVANLQSGLEGSTLNAGNFGQARRQFADMTLSPLWRNVSGSLQVILEPVPAASRLWYDDRDIPFLRQDQADQASIQQAKAQAVRELFMAGFEPDSIIAAVNGDDLTLLKHTGTFSIQVQTPGTTSTKLPSTVDEPPAGPESSLQSPPETPAIAAAPAPAAPPAGAGRRP